MLLNLPPRATKRAGPIPGFYEDSVMSNGFSRLILSSVLLAPVAAFAAVPAAVTSALTDAGADVATIGGAILVVVIAIVGFNYLRRVMH